MRKFVNLILSIFMLVCIVGAISCAQTTHEHNFVNYVYNEDATCTADGTKTAKCSNSDCRETKTITADGTQLEHDYTLKQDQDKHWQECYCGHKKDVQDHVFANYIYNEDATCTADGTKTAKCDGCSEINTLTADGTQLEHDYSQGWCADEQQHWKECSCTDKTNLENHDFQWIIDKEPTQTQTGLKHKECTVCEYKTMLNTQMPVLDHTHNFNQKVANGDYLKSKATCTAQAVYYYSCECGERGTLTFKYGSRLEHSYSKTWQTDQENHWKVCVCEDITSLASHTFDWVIDIEATENKTGLKHKECSVCKYKTEIGTVIPMVGHTHSYVFVKTVEPTCAVQGYDLYKCKCGQEDKTNLTDTLKHSFENVDCPICVEWMNKDYSHLDKYNDDYGSTFLGTIDNGEKFQELYERIDEKIRFFHENPYVDAELTTVGENQMLKVESIKFSDLGLSSDMALSVWDTYVNDNPLYYWLSKTVAWSSTNLILLTEQEYDTGEERSVINQKIYSEIQKQASIIGQDQSAYRKALAYHDAIINKVNYAYDANGNPETSIWAHNIVGVLDGEFSVCEGYSRTFQILLNYSGVENVCVTGTANGGAHAWNMVKLDDGKWYWFDLTWDDTNCKKAYADIDSIPSIYDYFCVAGSTFTRHVPNTSAIHGIDFLFDLPTPATSSYSGEELLLNQTFVLDGLTYVKVGSGLLELKLIQKEGAVTIPETVVYNGVTYKVVSIANKTIYGNQISCSSVIDASVSQLSIPSTVRLIYPASFANCNTLRKVIIANGTTVISGSAFLGCRYLTDVEIPKTVLSIGSNAFNACTRLDKIEFDGTKTEWQAIIKGSDWKLLTGTFVVCCNDGNISKVYS